MARLSAARNPYIIGRAVTEPERFFGRDDLFEFIDDQVYQKVRVILLNGQRRVGKTSILYQVPNFLDREKFLVVLFDLQGYSQTSLDDLLVQIERTITGRVQQEVGPIFKSDSQLIAVDPAEHCWRRSSGGPKNGRNPMIFYPLFEAGPDRLTDNITIQGLKKDWENFSICCILL